MSQRQLSNESLQIEKKLDDLISFLDDSILLFRAQNKRDYQRLNSFRLFEKHLKVLKSPKQPKNLIKFALFYWDLILLTLLSVLLATYLSYFIASYYATQNSDFSNDLKFESRQLYKWMISKWMLFNNFKDYSKEECALVLPDLLNSVLRPVDNCAMCHGLTEIKRVTNITKEDFLRNYAYTGVPVIITDAIKNWSALKLFNFNFLKNLYLNINNNRGFKQLNSRNPSSSRLSCQFFPYKTKFKSLVEVLEMNPDLVTSPWYVGWSNCNNYASKVLRKHYKRPYFLPDESEMSRLDWIFMGTPGYGAEIHIDDVNNPSWQAQISGIKEWTFKPQAECLLKCPTTLKATVFPGDIIVFDSNRWFHATFILGADLSLTIGSEYD